MAENVLNLPRAAGAGRPTVAASPAARLSRALALLGGRLARLLDGLSPGAHGPRDGQAAAADTGAADTLAGSRAFLDAMADAWAAGPGVDSGLPAGRGTGLDRSAAGPPQPIDLLTWGLGLTATELELMLLAAMADEHEGYASVLRALNPRAEVRAVAGDIAKHPGLVKSPMVGTAYLAPEPGKPNFVAIGDKVTAGQTLLIIEAMKTFNPIKAPKAGTVTQVLVENAQPVEFGEPLMVVE